MQAPSGTKDEGLATKGNLGGESFTYYRRTFLRADVPHGDNQGRPFTVAQPLAGRYQVRGFFASGGMGLLLEGEDLRTGASVLIKSILHYDVVPYARVQDREGFTTQLRVPRKTLETERRILVLLRNAGCNAVPHPNDFVYDINPLLAGPYRTEEGTEWVYDDAEMIAAEPYLVMERVAGTSLEEVLGQAPGKKLPEARCLRIMYQVADVLETLHRPKPLRPGMTWQLIYQDLKPANLLLSAQDRVTVLDLGGCQLLNLEAAQKLLPGACTAGYCAPECEQPYGLLTPATDVYTVGTNLFRMLTGKSPVEFLTPGLGKNQPRAASLDLQLLESNCRPGVRQLIERCLAWDPAQRFPNAAALKQVLAELVAAP
jgi:serine/threonine protein kinase